MGKVNDLTGQRFGRLVVIEATRERYGRNIIWRCKCDCGNIAFVRGGSLLSGRTKSCGCFHKEQSAINGKISSSVHAGKNTRLYNVWNSMKQRCFDTATPGYKNYGARGITVCDEWRKNFAAFRDWAIANGYDENAQRGSCTLDRIDNDKGYSPDNCRWVDMKVQSNNRRSNKNK